MVRLQTIGFYSYVPRLAYTIRGALVWLKKVGVFFMNWFPTMVPSFGGALPRIGLGFRLCNDAFQFDWPMCVGRGNESQGGPKTDSASAEIELMFAVLLGRWVCGVVNLGLRQARCSSPA